MRCLAMVALRDKCDEDTRVCPIENMDRIWKGQILHRGTSLALVALASRKPVSFELPKELEFNQSVQFEVFKNTILPEIFVGTGQAPWVETEYRDGSRVQMAYVRCTRKKVTTWKRLMAHLTEANAVALCSCAPKSHLFLVSTQLMYKYLEGTMITNQRLNDACSGYCIVVDNLSKAFVPSENSTTKSSTPISKTSSAPKSDSCTVTVTAAQTPTASSTISLEVQAASPAKQSPSPVTTTTVARSPSPTECGSRLTSPSKALLSVHTPTDVLTVPQESNSIRKTTASPGYLGEVSYTSPEVKQSSSVPAVRPKFPDSDPHTSSSAQRSGYNDQISSSATAQYPFAVHTPVMPTSMSTHSSQHPSCPESSTDRSMQASTENSSSLQRNQELSAETLSLLTPSWSLASTDPKKKISGSEENIKGGSENETKIICSSDDDAMDICCSDDDAMDICCSDDEELDIRSSNDNGRITGSLDIATRIIGSLEKKAGIISSSEKESKIIETELLSQTGLCNNKTVNTDSCVNCEDLIYGRERMDLCNTKKKKVPTATLR